MSIVSDFRHVSLIYADQKKIDTEIKMKEKKLQLSSEIVFDSKHIIVTAVNTCHIFVIQKGEFTGVFQIFVKLFLV